MSMRFVIPGSQVSDKHLLYGYDGNWKGNSKVVSLGFSYEVMLVHIFVFSRISY